MSEDTKISHAKEGLPSSVEREGAYLRLVRKLTKENLWLYILSLLREGPKYGYEIRGEIKKRFGFEPGRVTSYRVLYTLMKDGLVTIKTEEPSREGPARKYYMTTQKGEKSLKEAEALLRDLHKRLFE